MGCDTLGTVTRGTYKTLECLYTKQVNHRHLMTFFIPGQVYYGSLSVAHGSFPVRCVKRTEKSVWFEHVTMPEGYKGPKRSKIHSWGDSESSNAWRWYVSSDTENRDPSDVHDPYTR